MFFALSGFTASAASQPNTQEKTGSACKPYYEGINCDIEMRDKFIGWWYGASSECGSQEQDDPPWNLMKGEEINCVTFVIGESDRVKMYVTGPNDMIIPEQKVIDMPGSVTTFTISGTMHSTGTVLTMDIMFDTNYVNYCGIR